MVPLGLVERGLCARYAGDWTSGGTDFGRKSGVFWPDLGTASGTPAVQRCCTVSHGSGLTSDTLGRLASVLGCCGGAATVWRDAPPPLLQNRCLEAVCAQLRLTALR